MSKSEMVLITDTISGAMSTAEVKVSVHVQRDAPKLKGEPFTMLFQKLGVLTAKNIQPITAKLLLYLCSVVEYGNQVNKGPEQLGLELGFSRRQVERGLKELVDLKIVIKEKNPTDSRMVSIYLNPYQSWKGTVLDRKKKLAGYNDPRQLEMFPEEQPNILSEMSPKTLDAVSKANSDLV